MARPSARCSKPTAKRRARPRIAALRHGRRRRAGDQRARDHRSAAFAGRAFIALHMKWGAINEWTTQAGYARLAETAGHSTFAGAPASHHEARGRAHRLLRVGSDAPTR